MKPFPLQTAATIALFGCLMAAAPHAVPRLHGLTLSQFAAFADFSPERTPLSPLTAKPPKLTAVPRPLLHLKLPASSLLDDSQASLDHFYASLRAGGVTRIVHYGDSPTTADLITGDIRALLQERFGDAGHGFILVAKPWAWYQHRDVELSGSGWTMLPASRFEAHDGLFGLGGVSFSGSGSGHTRIALRDSGQSRFELYYVQQPGGGTVSISAAGAMVASIDTGAESKAAGFASFMVAGGASELEMREEGSVRLFGLVAEKTGPGVVYDSLGLNGASITVLTRMFNQQHWTEQLRHRNPNLVIVNYGTNEADFTAFIDHGYEKELREGIARLRAALPEASILIMSPMDRGYRAAGGDIETMETIPRIVAIQRRVARETGCAFFDTFAAMGGAGTMARWYTAQPRLVSADFIHPYPAGGRQIAEVFVREIEAGLGRFQVR